MVARRRGWTGRAKLTLAATTPGSSLAFIDVTLVIVALPQRDAAQEESKVTLD
jgi:hypothetical protein